MAFSKAVKSKSKLRLAMFGPSGGGKTYTSLSIATGIINKIGGRIAVIDTENGAASKYADKFDFDVNELTDKTIPSYIAAMKEASEAGYKVVIIDSMSHAWKELLEQVEKIAQARYRGNTWSAWSEGTPLQNELIDAILSAPFHLIATMRSKTEWSLSKNDRGKDVPTRVGLAPEQGKGIEYEFDMLFELTTEHLGTVIKDRTGKFQDEIMDKPGIEFGERLIDWLNTGADLPTARDHARKTLEANRAYLLESTIKFVEDALADTVTVRSDAWFANLSAKMVAQATAAKAAAQEGAGSDNDYAEQSA